MWPFNKRKKRSDILIMPRYTKETWNHLFPDSSCESWVKANAPTDITQFIKTSVVASTQCQRTFNSGIIATIDDKYLDWLKDNNKQHSPKILNKYIFKHMEDVSYWNDRLVESGMTNAYNVLAIQSLLMISDQHTSVSEYQLDTATADEIALLLSSIYGCDKLFVPGWIVKGDDVPRCMKDIVQLAEVFWENGSRVRFGKYMEQRYDRDELADKFTPIYCAIPFVAKTEILSSIINLSNNDFDKDDKTMQAMTHKSFSTAQKFAMFNLISSKVPQVISIGSNAVLPGQALVSYLFNKGKKTRVTLY